MSNQNRDAQRLPVLEAALAAIERREEVFAILSDAKSDEDAVRAVMDLLGLDEVGATAVLDLQVRRFSALGVARIRDEVEALRSRAPR